MQKPRRRAHSLWSKTKVHTKKKKKKRERRRQFLSLIPLSYGQHAFLFGCELTVKIGVVTDSRLLLRRIPPEELCAPTTEGKEGTLPADVGHSLALAHFVAPLRPLSRGTNATRHCSWSHSWPTLHVPPTAIRTEGRAPRPCRSAAAQGHHLGQGVRRAGAVAWRRSS